MHTYSLSEIEYLRSDMVNELQQYMPEYRLAAAFVNPRSIKNGGEKIARKLESKVLMNTAGMALRTSTSGMFNGATPKTRPWFNSVVSNPLVAKVTSNKQFIKREDDIIAEVMQVNNTYRALPLLYKDTLTFSTGAMLQLPHPIFGSWLYPLAMGTYSFACDAEGNPEMFCRDFVYTVKQVVDNYGTVDDNGKKLWHNFHPYIKECYEKAMYHEKVYLTTVIVPNRSWDPTKENKLDVTDRKFQAYTYIQRFGSASGQFSGLSARELNRDRVEVVGGNNGFLKCTGFSYFPVIISRWELLAEENFGTGGPTQLALADIMTFQEMQRGRLNAVDKILRPPMVGPASMRRHASSIMAGGITYVEDNALGATFKPAFEVNSRVAELIGSQADYKEVIEEAYFINLFMSLLGQDLKSHVSATEISSRTAEKLQLLGPALSQWDFDIGSKIIGNNRHILREQGRLEHLPEDMLKGDGKTPIRVEYVSTLALAQKAANLTTMERFLGVMGSVAQTTQDPSVVKIIKSESYLRNYGDSIGLDPNLLLTEDEYAKVKQAEQQKQAVAVQQAAALNQSEVAKNLGNAKVGQGSALDTLMAASSI
jgi:hypothetical protein